jgi:hypothetical protein
MRAQHWYERVDQLRPLPHLRRPGKAAKPPHVVLGPARSLAPERFLQCRVNGRVVGRVGWRLIGDPMGRGDRGCHGPSIA